MLKILLVDDEPSVGEPMRRYLENQGFNVTFHTAPAEAVACLEAEPFDIVVTDLRMPGFDGIEVIRRVKETAPETEVIVITGYATVENAVGALKAGAADFLHKPVEFEDLRLAIEKAMRLHDLDEQNRTLRQRIERDRDDYTEQLGADAFVGSSPAMAKVREMIGRAAASAEASVLLTGASGTGKELAAGLIHGRSGRSKGPFIPVNCSGFTPTLIESELFGHEKGAFTGADSMKKGVIELAHKGTLFLDEIGDMPTNLQSRLLRVLEEKAIRRVGGQKTIPVDFRLIAATNRDLPALVAGGEFRQDLYYRLNTFGIELPPLKGRREDIALLAGHYLGWYSRRMRKVTPHIDDQAMAALQSYSYPGNVRELRNMIERALMLSDGKALAVRHFMLDSNQTVKMAKRVGTTVALDLETLEQEAIRTALKQAGSSLSKAAELLGISRYALGRKMKKYAIGDADKNG